MLLKAMPVEPVSCHPCIQPPANYHIDIRFRRRDGDGTCICGRIQVQTVHFDVWSWWIASCLPILLSVSFGLISVTKLWDMIIRLCMCKGWMHHAIVLKSKSGGKTAIKFGLILQVTVKRQSKSNISDKMCWQNLGEWRHTCHSKSGQCVWRIDLNDSRHDIFIHVSNCITLLTDLVHMVEIFGISCGMSWKSRGRSWIRNGEEVKLYLPKTSEIIYLLSVAGRNRRNVIGPRHFSNR